MGHLRKRPYTKPIPPGAEFFSRKGKPYVRFKARNAKRIEGPVTKDGKRVRLLSKKWYGEYRGRDGILHTVPLSSDRSAAEILLAELVRKVEMGLAGCSDPFEEQRKRPLAEHVTDFRRYLEAKGNSAKHTRQTCNRVQAAFDGCAFVMMSDLSGSELIEWLADQRQANEMGDGLSIQTSNYYLRDCKSFCSWLVKDNRAATNPLAYLSGLNANVEDGLERRPLENDELALLLEAARKAPDWRSLSGPDRALLYIVAANIGFRSGEMASLKPEAFDLDATPPTVVVEAAYSKRRRRDVQPFRADLAVLVRDWLADKPAGELLWPGTWAERGAEMIRSDLAAARAAWVEAADEHSVERQRRERSTFLLPEDDAGRVFDFHALRHTFISNLARGGVHPKVVQSLARHSTITLTMDGYTHVALYDQAAALDQLPALAFLGLGHKQQLAATGTHGKGGHPPSPACAPACAAPADSCGSMRTDEEGDRQGCRQGEHHNPQQMQAVADGCGSMRPDEETTPKRLSTLLFVSKPRPGGRRLNRNGRLRIILPHSLDRSEVHKCYRPLVAVPSAILTCTCRLGEAAARGHRRDR